MKKNRSIFMKRVMAWLLTFALVVPMLASNVVLADDETIIQKKDFSSSITGNALKNADGEDLAAKEGASVSKEDTLTLHYEYAITESINVDDIYSLPMPSGIQIADTASGSAIMNGSEMIGTLYGDAATPCYIQFTSAVTGTTEAPVNGTLDISSKIDVDKVDENGLLTVVMLKGDPIKLAIGMEPPMSDVLPEQRAGGDFFRNDFAKMSDKKLEIKKDGASDFVVLKNNDSVAFGDELRIQYKFEISEENLMNSNLQRGETFHLPDVNFIIPGGTDAALSKGILIQVNNPDEGMKEIQLGTLSWNSADKKTNFEFAVGYGGELENYTGIENGIFEYYCKLDKDAIGDDAETIQTIFGGVTYTLTVEDNVKTETTIKKEASLDKGVMTWTVDITAGTKAKVSGTDVDGKIPEGAEFTDTITSEHVYEPGSFKYRMGTSGSWINVAEDDITQNTESNGISLKWTLPEMELKQTLQIQYKTVLSDDTIKDIEEGNTTSDFMISNTAEIPIGTASDKLTDTADVPIGVSDHKNQWIIKTQKNDFDPHKKTLDWELTLNGNARNIENVKVYDIMPKSQEITSAGVKFQGSLVVHRVLLDSEWPADVDLKRILSTEIYNKYIKDHDYQIIEIDLSGKAITSGSKITYTTKLTTDFSSDNSNTVESREFYNGAWLTFDWMEYGGVGAFDDDYEVPGVGKPFTVTALSIEKSGSYDRKTHRITWTIKLNGDHFAAQDIVVTDEIPADQTFVENSMTKAKYQSKGNGESDMTEGVQAEITSATSGQPTSLKFSFPKYDPSNSGQHNFGTDAVSFQYQTEVVDEADYGHGVANQNTSKKYRNKASVTGIFTSGGSKTITVTPEVDVISRVLEKTVGKYDYNTHRMTWTVTVNHNEMKMKNVRLEDIIPEGCYFLPETLKFQDPTTVFNYTYVDEYGNALNPKDAKANKKLTITLGDIDKKLIYTYQTEVDVDYKYKNQDGTEYGFIDHDKAEFKFENKITLFRDDCTHTDVNTKAICTVKNPLVTKVGKKQGTSGKEDAIDYDIYVNPNSVTLPSDAAQNFIFDQLPEELELDKSNIRLSECSIADEVTTIDKNNSHNVFIDGEKLIGVEKVPGAHPGDGIGEVPSGTFYYTYDDVKRELFVYLPKGAKPYHLKVTTFLTKPMSGNIVNKAAFGSVTHTAGSSETENIKVNLNLDGGATTGMRNGNVSFIKKNAEGKPLAGAKFSLTSVKDPTNVSILTTKDDGVIEFPKKSLGEYSLKEIEAPDGYMLDNREYKVTVGKSVVSGKIAVFHKIMLDGKELVPSEIPADKSLYIFPNKSLGKIIVEKVSSDTPAKPLEGAKFKLEKQGDAAFTTQTNTTGAAGNCSFEDLEAGTYIITEIMAPNGYQMEGQAQTVVIGGPDSSDASILTCTFTNYILGNIVVEKKDASTGNMISGATFTLYSVDDSGNLTQVGEPQKTDASGRITFLGLVFGKYKVKETEAAPGYYILEESAQPAAIEISKTDPTSLLQTIQVTNEPYAKITINKTNATTHELISGAKFALKDKDNNVIQIGTTDEKGELTFENVLDGIYTVIETEPAPGYIPNKESYEVTVDRIKLHPVLLVVNQHYGSIDITKVGPGKDPKKLKGVEFALYKVGEVSEPINPNGSTAPTVSADPAAPPEAATPTPPVLTATPQPPAEKPTVPPEAVPLETKTTDENGQVRFENLLHGDYILRELKTASGYVIKEYPLDAVITISQKQYQFEYTIVNERREDPDPDPEPGMPDLPVPPSGPSKSPSPSPSVSPTPKPSVTPKPMSTPKPEKTITPTPAPTRKPNVPSDPFDPTEPEFDLTDPDVPSGYSSPIIPGEPAGIEIGDEEVARGALDPEEEEVKPEEEVQVQQPKEEDLDLGDMDPAAGYRLPQTGERSGADTLVLIGGCLILIGGIFLGFMKLRARKKD